MKYNTPRARALKEGKPTYQGKPCTAGHEGIRETKNRRCVECASGPDSYYERNKEARKAYARARPKEITLHEQARIRAKKFGREFTLTREDIVIPKNCPILGIKMDSPSIDRIDNSKGYTVDNIHIISWRANKLKSDATPQELRRLADYFSKI